MSHDGVVEGGRISFYFHTLLIGKLLGLVLVKGNSKGEKVCEGGFQIFKPPCVVKHNFKKWKADKMFKFGLWWYIACHT